MPKKLEGKVGVIPSRTEGIGLATANVFVKEGACVFITGRRQKELDEAVEAIGRMCLAFRAMLRNSRTLIVLTRPFPR